MEKKRSVGVTVFGILFIVQSIIILILAVIEYLVTASYGATAFPVARLIYIILLLLVGLGLLGLKSWAEKLILFIIVPLFVIALPYFQFIKLKGLDTPKINLARFIEAIRILYGMLLLYFFTRPKVKEQFK
jgi:hypothetical protein